MAQHKARAIATENPSEVAIEITTKGEGEVVEVVRQLAPEGFPTDLVPQLADYMARGFNSAYERLSPDTIDLEDYAQARGRRTDPEVEEEAQAATRLLKQLPHLTFSKVVGRVCRFKGVIAGHRCSKKCTDRIRRAVKEYAARQEIETLTKAE